MKSNGYFKGVAYTKSYADCLSPINLKFLLTYGGYQPPNLQNVLELGFGQGVSLAIHSAGNSAKFHGNDFNVSHVGFASFLVSATKKDANLMEHSFTELVESLDDLPMMDAIFLHGIWSWVGTEEREAILKIINLKLKPGGVVCLGYNAVSGWVELLPVRTAFFTIFEALGSSLSISEKISTALEKIKTLFTEENSSGRTLAHINKMTNMPHNYLAHEYLNKDWHLFEFPEIWSQMQRAKLDYAIASEYPSILPVINFSTGEQEKIAEFKNDVLMQNIASDLFLKKSYRIDYWVKGNRKFSEAERLSKLRLFHIILVEHSSEFDFKLTGQRIEADLDRNIYSHILNVLENNHQITIGELETKLSILELKFSQLLEAVLVLLVKKTIMIANDPVTAASVEQSTRNLNKSLIQSSLYDEHVNYLASPVTGQGFPVNRLQQIFLAMMTSNAVPDEVEVITKVKKLLNEQSQILIDNGVQLSDENKIDQYLRSKFNEFRQKLPILTKLGINSLSDIS